MVVWQCGALDGVVGGEIGRRKGCAPRAPGVYATRLLTRETNPTNRSPPTNYKQVDKKEGPRSIGGMLRGGVVFRVG